MKIQYIAREMNQQKDTKMNIKLILYLLITPATIWVLVSLNLEKYFKKGRINQIKLFYLFLTFHGTKGCLKSPFSVTSKYLSKYVFCLYP